MYYGYGYPPYVSVADKQKKAEKLIEKLRKKGQDVTPIAAFRGSMAQTFWGKSWCKNLESYADYENRLERGRSYIRAGCVCHLKIGNGVVEALVNGSRLYSIKLTITPLTQKRWKQVCDASADQIGSLLELLQGKLSKNVMGIVCDAATGIFPSPQEIALQCSCPDSAMMCKHVTAALYGIGRRLDTEPELLFTLRGVNATDLIAKSLEFTPSVQTETLTKQDLGELFAIDLDADVHVTPTTTHTPAPKHKKSSAPIKAQTHKPPFNPKRPTGAGIEKLRRHAQLTTADFAKALGVSFTTINTWCSKKGVLTLRASSIKCLTAFQENLLSQQDVK